MFLVIISSRRTSYLSAAANFGSSDVSKVVVRGKVKRGFGPSLKKIWGPK